MTQRAPPAAMWTLARDPEPVHQLLTACDAYQATSDAPAPKRNRESTRRHVEAGSVQALFHGNRMVACFTLSFDPPFDVTEAAFPAVRRPAYMSRTAIAPDLLEQGSVLGVQCFRRAFDVARDAGADVLRNEINPDLPVAVIMGLLGYEQHGPVRTDGVRLRAYFQKSLMRGPRGQALS